jgi:LysR family transcriptional regulator, regulatory protein for tcuABC
MELRQLRSFVRVVELGSISRAAQGLGMAQSALSQQIGRLESELATRLLQRSPFGVAPSEAGVAFYREAQLTLRHAEQAVRSAQQARLSGSVSIGLAPTTAAMLELPLMQAMRARYPQVRLHMVESLSGHLASLLHARELDLAVLFDTRQAAPAQRHWGRHPLLEEDLFFICSKTQGKAPRGRARRMLLSDLGDTPLILPTGPHGLRSTLDAAFARAGVIARVDLEIDSLTIPAFAWSGSKTRNSSASIPCAPCRRTSCRRSRWPRASCCSTAPARWYAQATGLALRRWPTDSVGSGGPPCAAPTQADRHANHRGIYQADAPIRNHPFPASPPGRTVDPILTIGSASGPAIERQDRVGDRRKCGHWTGDCQGTGH